MELDLNHTDGIAPPFADTRPESVNLAETLPAITQTPMPRSPAGRVKQNIIWIASYPKSGNTWIRIFLHNLRREMDGRGSEPLDLNRLHEGSAWENNARDYEPLIKKPIMEASAAEIARARPEIQRRLANRRDSPFLVKTHLTVGMDYRHPTINLNATLAAIYVVRNPLDVAVSYTHHSGHSFEIIVRHMCTPGMKTVMRPKSVNETIGSWSQNIASWMAVYQRPVLFLRYEDLLAEPDRHFARIVSFLNWRPEMAQFKRAVEKSDFKYLAALEQEQGFRERPTTSQAFFRNGKCGSGIKDLPEELKDKIVKNHASIMQRFGYLNPVSGSQIFNLRKHGN